MRGEKILKDVIVYDNFFEDPDLVYNKIYEKLPRLPHAVDSNFVGERYGLKNKWVVDQINKAVDDPNFVIEDNDWVICQFVNKFNGEENWIHCDLDWTLIIYLQKDNYVTNPELCGTRFFSSKDERTETARVEYKYNRAVFFKGDTNWHMGGDGFGTDLHNCRLTIPVFYERELKQQRR